ncbi:MAG: hypothetical protein CM15mP58_23350 [Burkholderiaceae bacterium]|nr:MAG: hypothetical protein CM15mP58_23350 [Burkholderiaceae bacterium]
MRSVSILGILSIANGGGSYLKGNRPFINCTLLGNSFGPSILSSGDFLPSIDLPFIYAVILGFIY